MVRAPEVLTLHLKRFQQDMRGRLAKIKGRVPFPADLDITPFCDPKVPISRFPAFFQPSQKNKQYFARLLRTR